jgi:hypothetical protein
VDNPAIYVDNFRFVVDKRAFHALRFCGEFSGEKDVFHRLGKRLLKISGFTGFSTNAWGGC